MVYDPDGRAPETYAEWNEFLGTNETVGQWYLRKRQERLLNTIKPSLFKEKRTAMLKRYYG